MATKPCFLSAPQVGPFANLAKDMEKNSDDWMAWCDIEAAERAKMPGEWGKMNEFRQLLIIRALRPDRITSAMGQYCEKVMGSTYINQAPFDCGIVVDESSNQTPIFFVLFPGYSPGKQVEAYANKVGKTTENGKLTLISMGQGQEGPAEKVLDKYTKEGGWVFLDNLHLMQGWIPKLERKLEIAAEVGHADFRCVASPGGASAAGWAVGQHRIEVLKHGCADADGCACVAQCLQTCSLSGDIQQPA